MLKKAIVDNLDELAKQNTGKMLAARYEKFRAMGVFSGE